MSSDSLKASAIVSRRVTLDVRRHYEHNASEGTGLSLASDGFMPLHPSRGFGYAEQCHVR
jgi:hypothetical protein